MHAWWEDYCSFLASKLSRQRVLLLLLVPLVVLHNEKVISLTSVVYSACCTAL
jgi:hypothetical protein